MRKELLKGLTEDQIQKVKACENNSDLLQLAKDEGVELTEDQLDAVNGGFCTNTTTYVCPECGSTDVTTTESTNGIKKTYYHKCKNCQHYWSV